MEKHFCLYPVYIDSTKTLAQGRKFRRELCIPSPRHQEIRAALQMLGIEHIDEPGKKHPRAFFSCGRVQIKREYGKTFAVEGIVHTILEARRAGAEKPEHIPQGRAVHGVVQNGVYVENKLNLMPKKKKKRRKNK